MVEIDLRNALEYDATAGYAIFRPDYETLCYSDIDTLPEVPRKPQITNFEQYQKFLEESNLFFILADNEKEVGYIILDVTTSGTAQIKEMLVKKEFRGKGYGRRAVKKLLEELREDEEIKEVVVISATIATDCFYSACNFRYEVGDIYKYQLRE